MVPKKGQTLVLEIEDLAFRGRGLARLNGFTVFVDRALPGDRVEARIYRKKKNYAEARVLEVLSPSPDRVTAPCRYSGYCGGCTLQSLSYEKQVFYKRRHVAESLAHIGLFSGIPVHPTRVSEQIFGYRNKMEFSCSDRRWLLPEELGRDDVTQGMALGLHVPGTFHKVLDIEACLIQPSLGNTILGHVREYIRTSDRPVYGLRSHEGFWRFVMLRHSVATDTWMVNLVTRALDREAVQPLADALRRAFPRVASVVNNVTARKAGIAVGEFEVCLAGVPVITDRIGDLEFQISANSFFQTNTRGAETLYGIVKAYAGLKGNETVVDLYCGTGTIALFLAHQAKTVIGIEQVADAVADARRNCRRNHIDNCRFEAGDAGQVLAALDVRPQVMVIDPPRAGMHQKVLRQVMALAPGRIVYVSCNPTTLARDLALMAEAYEVAEVQPVDLFPHTFHVESVARLEKKP